MGATKKRVDIETLVRWAYVEELPKKGVGGDSSLTRLLLYGTAIDESHYGDRAPIAFGEPHPDALLLDWHVTRLEPMVLTVTMARHLLGHLAPYLMREIVRPVETAIVKRGKREIAGIVTATQTESKDDVAAREVSPAALITIHAKLGNRPNWDVGPASLTRVMGANNKPKVVGITKGRRYGEGAYSPLQLSPSAQTIALARFEYAVWWMALMQLVASCRLSEHEPVKPAARPEPWLTGEEPEAKIHRGGHVEIPEQRQKVYAGPSTPPTRSGKVRHIPFTTPTDGA